MAKGRAEVLGLVARRRYGELMERDLGDRRLQRSMLDIRCGLTCCGATVSQQPVTLAMRDASTVSVCHLSDIWLRERLARRSRAAQLQVPRTGPDRSRRAAARAYDIRAAAARCETQLSGRGSRRSSVEWGEHSMYRERAVTTAFYRSKPPATVIPHSREIGLSNAALKC